MAGFLALFSLMPSNMYGYSQIGKVTEVVIAILGYWVLYSFERGTKFFIKWGYMNPGAVKYILSYFNIKIIILWPSYPKITLGLGFFALSFVQRLVGFFDFVELV